MSRIAFVCLHYGSEYLGWAIKSVLDAVDEVVVVYSPHGSHGTAINEPPPALDREEVLFSIAQRIAGDKLSWNTVENVWHEGQHRDLIYTLRPKVDVILTVDADEIWQEGAARDAIELAVATGAGQYRIPFVHFWRSFRRCVTGDPAWPARIVVTGAKKSQLADAGLPDTPPVAHMGYAIRPELMAYKWKIHGHKRELRRDVDWFKDVFMANRQTDCHPVGSDFWNAEEVNPLDYMPDWMRHHPYFDKDVIR